ncbi:hypothetical protein ACH6CV_11535 [Bacillota bacterium Meth-B3]|nr:hypothetical protein [Christensenellaceae bacterium]MEA5067789.1 hypothetical protein [Christensenellaceae bacterium]
MELWEQQEEDRPGAPEPDAVEANEPGAPITAEEMDAVVDELIAIASRMAAERTAEAAGGDAAASEQRQLAFARSLLAQEDAILKTRPDFDLEGMLREHSAFRALVLAGEPVERALNYVSPGEDERQVERAVLERIRRRATRPQPMGSANRPARPSAQERLSEEEVARIDAQLKRGQKVYLND